MTDLSSEDNHVAEMAGELMQAKMDAVRAPQTMTHLLQLGSFRMEIVPDRNIDIEKVFKDTIADLHKKFGDNVLKINMTDIMKQQPPSGGMHG